MSLSDQVAFFKSQMEHCMLCPRQCGVNRLKGETGFCNAGSRLKVASYCLHRGEEPPISGTMGSGTIFFSHCSMKCVYCQNYPISQLGYGNVTEVAELATMMLDLERRGAHNINLVTATHFLPQVAEAIVSARDLGLTVPVVSNTSGYERAETIRMLDGLVQVYLVDMRYSRSESSARYSGASDYPAHNRAAVREMLDRVGPLEYRRGLAAEGVLIRHLIIPSLLTETREILEFVNRELSPTVPVSIMTQYFPANTAGDHPEIDRKISRSEYREALDLLEQLDTLEGWVQNPRTAANPVT
jgi:putative pyruvate formate lyase activating enzyme